MANRFRTLIPAVNLLALPITLTLGQETPPPLYEFSFYVASNSRIHNVRFGEYDTSATLTGSHRTGFRTSGRSLKYDYKGPLPIVFFEETSSPNAADPDHVQRTPVATASPPKESKNLMFLFSKNHNMQDGGDKYHVDWVDLEHGKIPPGHITIFNTLSIPLKGGVLQDRRDKEASNIITASPGINLPIEIAPKAKVILTLETESEGLLRAYEDTIFCGPDERVLLVIFPPRFPGSYKLGSKIITLPVSSKVEKE